MDTTEAFYPTYDTGHTFESLAAHVETHAPAIANEKDVTSPAFWEKFCKLHKVVGPIVSTLASIPIIPQQWRGYLQSMVAMMDLLCLSHDDAMKYFSTITAPNRNA